MRDIIQKIDNTSPAQTGRLSAAEFNSIVQDLLNHIRAAGISLDTLSDTDLFMMPQASARIASGGTYGRDVGAVNAYSLVATGSFVPPKALFEGMRVRFFARNANTGASTLNAFGLGAKALRDQDGVALTAGAIILGRMTEADYDPSGASGAGCWRLTPASSTATITDPGYSGLCVPVSKLTLTYTGSDQVITVPSGATYMQVKLWGAACAYNANAPDAAAGGYTTAWFSVTAGTQYTVVVGQGGADNVEYSGSSGTYGFGGKHGGPSNDSSQGGGLTGIFTGTGTVLSTDTSRALAIAGGASGGDIFAGVTSAGEQGNGSGGQANMQGQDGATTGAPLAGPGGGGGGGGYAGGNRGKGGSGFIHASKVAGTITSGVGLSGDTPPGTSDLDYVVPYGAANATASTRGQHGLAVIRFSSGTCP